MKETPSDYKVSVIEYMRVINDTYSEITVG